MQADEGFLYPLERAFFYIHKPPMLMPHDEIAGIEFMRQGGGVLAASAKTFDLSIRLASNDQARLCCPHLESCCAQWRCDPQCLQACITSV